MVCFFVGGGSLFCVIFFCLKYSVVNFFIVFEVTVEGEAQLQKRLMLKSNVLLFQSVLALVKALK